MSGKDTYVGIHLACNDGHMTHECENCGNFLWSCQKAQNAGSDPSAHVVIPCVNKNGKENGIHHCKHCKKDIFCKNGEKDENGSRKPLTTAKPMNLLANMPVSVGGKRKSKKGSRKGSRKLEGSVKRKSKKGSRKGSRKLEGGVKRKSKKGSRKGSKKGQKKESRK